MAAATIDLKNGMSEDWIACFGEDGANVRIGFLKRVPTDERAFTVTLSMLRLTPRD